MALGKSLPRINLQGGGDLRVRELYPTPTDNWSVVGYIQGTNLADAHEVMEIVDETGEQIDEVPTGQSVTITTQLMQSTIDEMNLVKDAASKYYELYYHAELRIAKHFELRAIGRIKPGLNISFAAKTIRTIQFEFSAVAVKGAVTGSPAALDMAAGDYYVITENTSAQNPPSTAAATVASAALNLS
jgi:hypothetical protein